MISRQEIKDKYTEYIKTPSVEQRSKRFHEVVDIIYDGFEPQVCDNCKFYGAKHEHVSHPNYRTCINTESFTYMQEPHYSDGYNKWEAKDDE